MFNFIQVKYLLVLSMSSINVDKVAKLAMIKITDVEKKKHEKLLHAIEDVLKNISVLDAKNIEPLVNIVDEVLGCQIISSCTNKIEKRDKNCSEQENITKNAEFSQDGYFVVPKVVN